MGTISRRLTSSKVPTSDGVPPRKGTAPWKAAGGLLLLICVVSITYYFLFYDLRVETPRNRAQSSANVSGVNLQPSYYNNGVVTIGWDTMRRHTKIQSVRIGVEPGLVDEGREWIRQANEEGYHAIVAYHKYSVVGSDDASELQAAAEWWRTNFNFLSEAGPFDINLMDKWGSHTITSTAYANAYNTAIATVRTVYSGPIVVDIPGRGQETSVAITASPLIWDQDVVFSAHVYPQSYNQAAGRYMTPGDVEDLLQKTGRPCIVGEFGDIQPDPEAGQCDVKSTVEAAKATGYEAVYGWAWNGDGGSLNMVSPTWAISPTAGSYSETDYFWTIMDSL